MANKTLQNLAISGTQYNRYYTGMGGVDMTGDGSGIAKNRFAYLENMYRDYDGEGAGITESIPGFRKILSLGEKIHAIHLNRCGTEEYLIIHAGHHLYRRAIREIDSAETPVPIGTAADRRSCSFPCGDNLYLLDGEHYLTVDKDGVLRTVGEEGAEIYVPTTYKNGEEYEQRNLLSDRFKEEVRLSDPTEREFFSEGLAVQVLSEENLTCSVIGRGTCTDTAIRIPAAAEIDGVLYKIVKIGQGAFRSDASLKWVALGENVTEVEVDAFRGCACLEKVIFASGTRDVGNYSFAECPVLKRIYLGAGLASFGKQTFASDPMLRDAYYEEKTSQYYNVTNYEILAGEAVYFHPMYVCREIALILPVYDPATQILSVTVGGESVPFETRGAEFKHSVILFVGKREKAVDAPIVIRGILSQTDYAKSDRGRNFLSETAGFTDGAGAAILGCTVCEVFDGRVFLSGNPKLPNTVFYTARDERGMSNPTYFGILNYFSDGIGNFPVRALLSVGDTLAVFKSGDEGNGTIYYHTPKETGEDLCPKIYPVSYVHSGIYARGDAISFFDDPVFVSENGISALDKKAINLEKSVVCRSHNVNNRLLCEDLSEVRLAKWCGYLVVSVGGRMYLADSRQLFTHASGATEYEWYYLTGIGTYAGDSTVYRYAPAAPDGYAVSDTPDGRAEGSVYSEGDVLYVPDGGRKIAVYATEERLGGTFSPAVSLLCAGARLFFGTESGDVCVFNNDKRGVPPERIRRAEDFDPAVYAENFGRRIHPDFYSFASHAPRYALKTCMDNCGIPHLTKDTVKHSLVIKCRTFSRSSLCVEVGTDRGGYREVSSFPGTELNFADLDFSSLTVEGGEYFSLPISEKEKNWMEKQIGVWSDAFASPIGLYSLSYRYTVRGPLKL